MLSYSENVISGTICGDPTSNKKTRGTVPIVAETNTSDKEGVGAVFSSRDFDNDTVDILMASWRKGNLANYLYMQVNGFNLHLVTRFHLFNRQFRLY